MKAASSSTFFLSAAIVATSNIASNTVPMHSTNVQRALPSSMKEMNSFNSTTVRYVEHTLLFVQERTLTQRLKHTSSRVVKLVAVFRYVDDGLLLSLFWGLFVIHVLLPIEMLCYGPCNAPSMQQVPPACLLEASMGWLSHLCTKTQQPPCDFIARQADHCALEALLFFRCIMYLLVCW